MKHLPFFTKKWFSERYFHLFAGFWKLTREIFIILSINLTKSRLIAFCPDTSNGSISNLVNCKLAMCMTILTFWFSLFQHFTCKTICCIGLLPACVRACLPACVRAWVWRAYVLAHLRPFLHHVECLLSSWKCWWKYWNMFVLQ